MVMNRNRLESYIARGDCHIMKLGRQVFEEIMAKFKTFKEEVSLIVAEREKKRIEQMQQENFKQHDLTKDLESLQKLLKKVDISSIAEDRRRGILQRRSTISVAEFNNLKNLKKKKLSQISAAIELAQRNKHKNVHTRKESNPVVASSQKGSSSSNIQ